MILEFKNSEIIEKSLYKELKFDSFLSLFEIKMPILADKKLSPLTSACGKKHFADLLSLELSIKKANTDLSLLIKQSQQLPYLDTLILFFKKKELEQFHIFTLGNFLKKNTDLIKTEKAFPLEICRPDIYSNMLNIIKPFTDNNFSIFTVDPFERKILNKIEVLTHKIEKELITFEKQIRNSTNLKMVYPYIKKISKSRGYLSDIVSSHFVKVKRTDNKYLVDYNLPDSIKELQKEKSLLYNKYKVKISNRLLKLNNLLSPFFYDFKKVYEKREHRTFNYILLWAKKKHGLCIPKFKKKYGITLKNGILPALNKKVKGNYKPLTITLNKGSNLLSGANMTGKTTVIKTVFFNLSLILFGLPVPAETVNLSFPENIRILLKSSGDINKNSSGFTRELSFITKENPQGTFILIDEFFQSTNPVCGAKLSEIFLSYFKKKEIVFFCCSHYPDLLNIKNINLLMMQDARYHDFDNKKLDFTDFIKSIPFEIKKTDSTKIKKVQKEAGKPFYLALMYPVPKFVEKKILSSIKRIENGTDIFKSKKD